MSKISEHMEKAIELLNSITGGYTMSIPEITQVSTLAIAYTLIALVETLNTKPNNLTPKGETVNET